MSASQTLNWLQVVVEVNERSINSGDSCFDVEYWDGGLSAGQLYTYAFGIGYSYEFNKTGYGNPEFNIIMNSQSQVTSMTLQVQSDSWVIYPSNLCNSAIVVKCGPTITLPSSNKEQFVMVGPGGGVYNVNFGGAGGTLYYWDVSGTSGSGIQTAETSNMVYGSATCTGSENECTQSYHYP